MSAPNPFLFGGGQPAASEMANPFMDASQGMAEVNPFMAQQNMMGQGGYGGGYNQFGQPSMGGGDPANPFGDYSSMGYQQPNMMYNNFQAQNPYADQYGQMAHMNTNTNSVPSNVSQPSAAAANVGAALFGVGPETPSSVPSITSPPECNPFLSGPVDTPSSVTSVQHPVSASVPESGNQTPAAINPFADTIAQEDQSFAQPETESKVLLENNVEPEVLITERPTTLVNEMVGGLEVSTTDMLEKLDIAKTPVIVQQEIAKAESDSDSDSDTEEAEDLEKKPVEDSTVEDIKPEMVTPNIQIDEPSEPVAEEKQQTGFGGVFSNKPDGLGEPSETMQSATSHVDLNMDDATEGKEQSEEDKAADVVSNSSRSTPELEEDVTAEAPKEESSGFLTGGTAAGLFDDAPTGPVSMSTGDAIFSDLPSVPNIKSTGAAIFGISDESAAGSTGAALFDITAPEMGKPCHGEMSGWDENFDKKFEKAEMQALTGPITAFGAGSTNSAAAFGYGAPPSFGDDPSFGDSFGMLPVTADMNNPFLAETGMPGPGKKSGDGEGPETPLFDDDVSKPLENFPRLDFEGVGWDMYIRHPPKKKITSQRFWKKVHVKIVNQGDNPAILLFDSKDAKEPFQELPLQAAYSLSDISHQVFDQYSKIFTIKLQYIFYKERAGIRPGQVTKMQKLTDKIGFLAKAVEDADLHGVKEFASDMKKLGVPLEHAPQISELLKLASTSFEDMKQFSTTIEEKLFKLDVHRDRALTYKTEEVQMTAVDEVYVEQAADGHILKQLCRVRVFFLSFLSGMPEVDLGVNDMTRMGLEVVGRHDILPVPTEQWIRYENIEFHSVVNKKAFDAEDHIIKFQPPDGCYIEVMRFRTRPPRARELPMQARCKFIINGNKVEIRADIMVPYHATKAWGQERIINFI